MCTANRCRCIGAPTLTNIVAEAAIQGVECVGVIGQWAPVTDYVYGHMSLINPQTLLVNLNSPKALGTRITQWLKRGTTFFNLLLGN